MKFHLLGLFPDLLSSCFSQSLIGKAVKNGLLEFQYHQLRDWSKNDYHSVDEKPYGGGAGMVFMPDIVCQAVRDLKAQHRISRVVMPTPAGQLLTSAKAKTLSEETEILFLCGRYEGIDERAVEAVVDDEISIGDYVITGGELAAGVMIDAISRYVPGVVGKEISVASDSHSEGLLEYPHYTRPEVFEGQAVPSVLLSGHHQNIETWRHEQALRRTWLRRPDLLKRKNLTAEDLDFLKHLIHSTKE